MALRKASDDSVLSQSELLALTTSDSDPTLTFTEQVLTDTTFEGATDRIGRAIAFNVGDTIQQSALEAFYADPVVSTIEPVTGGIAGGTPVTIMGSGFSNGLELIGAGGLPSPSEDVTVKVGGVECTDVVVLSDTMLTAVTGAHAAGAVAVEVDTDSGTGSEAGLYTYA